MTVNSQCSHCDGWGQIYECCGECSQTQVYLIGAIESKTVKIGFSGDPGKRMKALQTGCPVTLSMLLTFPGGRSKEAELHEQFAALRLEGEWFSLERPIQEFIAAELRNQSVSAAYATSSARVQADHVDLSGDFLTDDILLEVTRYTLDFPPVIPQRGFELKINLQNSRRPEFEVCVFLTKEQLQRLVAKSITELRCRDAENSDAQLAGDPQVAKEIEAERIRTVIEADIPEPQTAAPYNAYVE